MSALHTVWQHTDAAGDALEVATIADSRTSVLVVATSETAEQPIPVLVMRTQVEALHAALGEWLAR